MGLIDDAQSQKSHGVFRILNYRRLNAVQFLGLRFPGPAPIARHGDHDVDPAKDFGMTGELIDGIQAAPNGIHVAIIWVGLTAREQAMRVNPQVGVDFKKHFLPHVQMANDRRWCLPRRAAIVAMGQEISVIGFESEFSVAGITFRIEKVRVRQRRDIAQVLDRHECDIRGSAIVESNERIRRSLIKPLRQHQRRVLPRQRVSLGAQEGDLSGACRRACNSQDREREFVASQEDEDPEVVNLVGDAYAVQAVAMDPKGRYWASASTDGEVKIWHYDMPAETSVIRHEREILRVFARSDNSQILGGKSPAEGREVETGAMHSVPSIPHLRRVTAGGEVMIADSLFTTSLSNRCRWV